MTPGVGTGRGSRVRAGCGIKAFTTRLNRTAARGEALEVENVQSLDISVREFRSSAVLNDYRMGRSSVIC
jgi:hypothetical protein